MKSELLNSKQISHWAYNKMRNINKSIKQWSQSGPLPMGRNAIVPKWAYSNNRNKLYKMFNIYKKQPDQYFRTYDKSGRTRESMLTIGPKLQDKLKFANIRHNMKLHPQAMAYKDDLKFANGFKTSKERIHAYSKHFEPNTSLIPASTVKKDLKKFNKLDSTDASMFLSNHPKFSMAVGAFSAQTVYDSYKRGGISTKSLTNMNEVYNETGLMHGQLDSNIHPGELQVRAVKYIHQKEQIDQGKQFSHALTQSASIFLAQHQEPDIPNGDWLRQAPDLQAKLHVMPGNFITRNNKDRHKVYDIETRRPLSDKAFKEMNYNYMVRNTKRMAHTLKTSQLSTNSVLQQANQITKNASKPNKQDVLNTRLHMDNLQLKMPNLTPSDKKFFTKDKQINLKKIHQHSFRINKNAFGAFKLQTKSTKQHDNKINQVNNKQVNKNKHHQAKWPHTNHHMHNSHGIDLS